MGPSARFVRAVAAERADLERQRARLAREATELRASLARIEHGLAEIDTQCGLLERLVPAVAAGAPGPTGLAAAGVGAGGAGAAPSEAVRIAGAGILCGPAIREAAVAVLLARGLDGLHYREWFRLLVEAGHQVAGKDPLAVFLTQLGRSPAVRRGAQPGHYELDRQAQPRLRAELQRLHRELRELTATDLTAIRARRAQITASIGRTEKALDEVKRVLGDLQDADAA